MRHKRAHRKFGRVANVRSALIKGLARSLILEEGITTTVAKAKELRPYVERLVTASKANTLASKRRVVSELGDLDAMKKLHEEIAKRYASRNGGYVRIVRLGRVGKRAIESARIEFVK